MTTSATKVEAKATQTQKPDIFFEQQLANALKAVKAKENLLVYSHPKGGKTVFLHQLKERLEQTKQYLPVLITSRMTAGVREFLKKNTARILEEHNIFGGRNIYNLSLIEADRAISSSQAGEGLKSCVKTLIIFEHDPSAKTEEALEAFLSLPAALAKEKKAVPVLLIDDADALKGEETPEMLERMRAAEESVVVMSGSTKKEGTIIDLTSVSLEDTRRFARKLNLDEAALSMLHTLTGGNVLYLSMMSKALQRSGAKTADGVRMVAEEMLANELELYFSEKLKQLSPKELLILDCMAQHDVNTPARISKILNYPQTAVRRFLAIMEEKGFVELRERGVFEIYDPMLKRWLMKER